MIAFPKYNQFIYLTLRRGLLIGASTVAISLLGCGDNPDDSSAGTGANATAGAQGGSNGSAPWPGDSGGPGDWPGGTGPGAGVPSDWPNPNHPGESTQESEDLRFSFVLPGTSEPYDARVLGGVKGTTVVIDKAPKSYGFELTYGFLPTGFPRKVDDEFCSMIEGYVETVESGNTAAPMALKQLRDFYPLANFKIPFGFALFTQLRAAVREAASSAGALGNLRIRNAPTFRDLSFDMVFTNDSLTRRMGDHEKAKAEFRAQFLKNASSLGIQTGQYPGGTNWPDLLCDLYKNRAQMSITISESGWSTIAEVQSIVPTDG